jgi:hypothetical protein
MDQTSNTITQLFRTLAKYMLQAKPAWKDLSSLTLIEQVLTDSGLSMNGRQMERVAKLIDKDRGLV